ncbi:hypothetical protein MMC10_003421 [Thelotrema lepadinum]|nr:hypothetical protein [Thelotrema lepadinum]
MSTASLIELQRQLINKLKAIRLAAEPYHNELWQVGPQESVEDAKRLNQTFRVFYLQRYIERSEIRKLVTHVPYICTAGDSFIQTQDLKIQSSLEAARKSFPGLIDSEERRLSRSKCIASGAKCYAIGGYKSKVKPLGKTDIFDCIVISGAGPQFEAPYLDYADFIFTKRSHTSRLPKYAHFGDVPEKWEDIVKAAEEGSNFIKTGSGKHMFHKTGYLTSMTECMHLWLSAFNQTIRQFGMRKGYFKISAIGCGFFSDVAGAGVNIGTTLMPILVKATEAALRANSYPAIGCVEFCDFSGDGSFAPTTGCIKNGEQEIRLIHGPRSDVLDFPKEVVKDYVLGLLDPSDCFACVGNETRYLSVESMIGDNTTIRSTQCYIWNEQALDEDKYIPV